MTIAQAIGLNIALVFALFILCIAIADDKEEGLIAALIFSSFLSFWGWIGFIAVHFIAKFW